MTIHSADPRHSLVVGDVAGISLFSAAESAKRLVVSNGSKRIELMTEAGGWEAVSIDHPCGIPNGIYSLHAASVANESVARQFDGMVLLTNRRCVYVKTEDAGIVRFNRHAFDALPRTGETVSFQFKNGRANVQPVDTALAAGFAQGLHHIRQLNRPIRPQQATISDLANEPIDAESSFSFKP